MLSNQCKKDLKTVAVIGFAILLILALILDFQGNDLEAHRFWGGAWAWAAAFVLMSIVTHRNRMWK